MFSNLLCIENVSVCNEVFHEASEDVLSIEGEALPKLLKLVLLQIRPELYFFRMSIGVLVKIKFSREKQYARTYPKKCSF